MCLILCLFSIGVYADYMVGPTFGCESKVNWRTFMNYLDTNRQQGVYLMLKNGQCSSLPSGERVKGVLIDSGYVGAEPVATFKSHSGKVWYTTPNAIDNR